MRRSRSLRTADPPDPSAALLGEQPHVPHGAFRKAFARDPRQTLEQLLAEGVNLTETEITALIGTRAALWAETGEQIDPHLQKADLRSE